jgi:hypothetical protein
MKMKRSSSEEIMLARIQAGWAPQIRYWGFLVSLGYDWAKFPLEQAQTRHKAAMAAIDEGLK